MKAIEGPLKKSHPGTRFHWMDALRGLAILLVILQHSTGVARVRGVELEIPFIELTTGLLAPYRMPLLLILSGLLLLPSLEKPLPAFMGGKVRKILWPYLFWGVVIACVTLSPDAALTVEYWRDGPSVLWFLTVLLIAYAFAPLSRWIPPILVSIGLIGLLLIVDPSTNFYRRAIFWGAFFYFGAALHRVLPWLLARGVWFPALGGAIGIVVAIASAAGTLHVDHDAPLSAVLPLPGVLSLIWLASRLPRQRALEAVGRQSIVYYCVHAPVLILITQLWSDLATTSPLGFWLISLIAAIAIPALMARFTRAFGWMFDFGRIWPKRDGAERGARSVGSA